MLAVSIILLVLAAMLGGLALAWWHGRHHLFSVLFVAAVVTLAAAMTIGGQPDGPKPIAATKNSPPPTVAPTGSSTPTAADNISAGAP